MWQRQWIWPFYTGFHQIWFGLRWLCFLKWVWHTLCIHCWIKRTFLKCLIQPKNELMRVFYPEPALISAVVGLALLLPLPPLDQAGGMVSRQADVTAAGCGADSSPCTSREEGLCDEWQLHRARQRHKEGPVGTDSVWTLSVVWERNKWVGHTETEFWLHRAPTNHTCTPVCINAARAEKSVKKHQSVSLIKQPLENPMR